MAELVEGVGRRELGRIAHGLADVVDTAYGAAIVHGIDLDSVIVEVHRANMAKLGHDEPVVPATSFLKSSMLATSPLKRYAWQVTEAMQPSRG